MPKCIFVSLTQVCVAKQRSENVRRLKAYLSEQGEHELANDASEILKRHRGKEKLLFKKLVRQFGGVLRYCSGVKKKKRKAGGNETQSNKLSKANSTKAKPNSSKVKSNSSKVKPNSSKVKSNSSKTKTIEKQSSKLSKANSTKAKAKATTAVIVPLRN